MASQPIESYVPQKYDHVARPLNFKVITSNVLKHHAIIIKPDIKDVLKSRVIHYGGKCPEDYRLRENSLGHFIGKHNKLYVYEHTPEDIQECKDIDAKIEEYKANKPEYSFLGNNCEDIVCQLMLKENNSYVKHSNIRSVFKFIYKSLFLGAVITLGSVPINMGVFVLHTLKIKQFDVDPLDWHDNRLTDPNKRRVYHLGDIKKRPISLMKVLNYCLWGGLAIITIWKIKEKTKGINIEAAAREALS
jgi:hypothetical protein